MSPPLFVSVLFRLETVVGAGRILDDDLSVLSGHCRFWRALHFPAQKEELLKHNNFQMELNMHSWYFMLA